MMAYHKKYPLSLISFIFIIKLLLLISSSIVSSSSMDNMLKGNKISCKEEGQIVTIPFLKYDPCITCMCVNGEIDCFKNTCPQTLNCYHFQSKNRTNSCCRKCLHCSFADAIINNGETIQDRKDICKSYYCHSGTLTSYKTECYVPCDKPIKLSGQCCPSCNICPSNLNKDGDDIPIMNNNGGGGDPCIKCYCSKGHIICQRKVCPVLPCHRSEWIKTKNSCCPICKGNKVIDDGHLSDGACVIGSKIYRHKEKFVQDECTTCICHNSTNICQRQSCPRLSCPEEEQFKNDGQCCARCSNNNRNNPPIGTSSYRLRNKGMANINNMDCIYQNRLIKNGEWADNCKQCKCIGGHIECSNHICPQFVCPFGHRKVKVNGECCESCVPEDGKCVAKDSMSNITTYDGKNYQWMERCNYILSRDCGSKQFSIHLLNKFHNNTFRPPKYKGTSFLVKIENTRIFLSHMGRVRVNRTLVQLPYISIGRFSIIKSRDSIKLHSLIGLDILWKHDKLIEIKIKSHFRDRTCGLCGNYNMDPDDEFKMKKHISPSINHFVNSFKIGQNILCPKQLTKFDTLKIINRKDDEDQEQKSLINEQCKRWNNEQSIQSIIRVCNKMNHRYGPCNGEGNDAFKNCIKNMCACRGDKRCHCYVIDHFIKDCNNNNGTLTIWQTSACKSLQCPIGARFIFCSFECSRSCPRQSSSSIDTGISLSSSPSCRRKQCKPGCYCNGNRVWFKGQCIPEKRCPR